MMSNAHTWRGVLGHLSFLQDNSGNNGLAKWAPQVGYGYSFPFMNRRTVEFDYGDGATKTGGRTWIAEMPGPMFGLPPAAEVKFYAHETRPDIGIMIAGGLTLSFDELLLQFGLNVLLHPQVQRVAKGFLPELREMFEKMAEHAPSVAISGALGFSIGIDPEQQRPYVRMLTFATAGFNTGLFGVLPGGDIAARFANVHRVDFTGGRGGGRSWQISGLGNIPRIAA